jgi:hypothetical protein
MSNILDHLNAFLAAPLTIQLSLLLWVVPAALVVYLLATDAGTPND